MQEMTMQEVEEVGGGNAGVLATAAVIGLGMGLAAAYGCNFSGGFGGSGFMHFQFHCK